MTGKLLIYTGIVLVIVGMAVQFLPGDGLPRLPGDIVIKNENFRFYFPLGWCILISLILSLLFWMTGK